MMSNILLVEPAYRSKFPPLGLLRISTFHKERGDSVSFARGKLEDLRAVAWHKVYISSLFTYELPKTIDTIRYYSPTVPERGDVIVGGIAATLMPGYIRERVRCTIVEGPLDRAGKLGPGTPALADLTPDYSLLKSVPYNYQPSDAYFVRVTKGCIRRCRFCAVPILEPEFGYCGSVASQVRGIASRHGEQQNLVLLDNNILAIDGIEAVIGEIRDCGFQTGAKRNGRQRWVDCNQGLDARLITPRIAKLLSTVALSPVRLAFDSDNVERPYRGAVATLAQHGFGEFTTYVMYNFLDSPKSFYERLRVNVELSAVLGIRVTGFPMRYVPITDIERGYVSPHWEWRYLRGIQCILLATHGMVSPSAEFFEAAFGSTVEEFLEIVSMPDRYIIYRQRHSADAAAWRRLYRSLSASERGDFLQLLASLHRSRLKYVDREARRRFGTLLQHYYPDGIPVARDMQATLPFE